MVDQAPSAWVRFWRFQGVGALGIVVQLAALTFFKESFHLSAAVAAGLAVETAILHNFFWHERWTWKRESGSRNGREIFRLLVKFHLGAGAVSLFTNIVLTGWLADGLHWPYLWANLAAIGSAGLLNFLINHRLVFQANGSARQD